MPLTKSKVNVCHGSRSPLDPKNLNGSISSISISIDQKSMGKSIESNTDVRKPSRSLYLAAASALMGAVCMGTVLGWTAPAFDDMERVDSEPRLTIEDKNIKTWIGSSMTLGALVGALAAGPLSQYIGRRISLIIYGLPFTLGWFLLFFSKSTTALLIGRIITGICAGLVSGTAPTYVIEISTPNVRGLLGTCFQLCVTIGILMVYVFGSFLTWNWLCIVCLIPGLLMSIMMFRMPETPIWLLTKSKRMNHSKGSKVEISLSRLRHKTNDNESELLQLVQQAEDAKHMSGFNMQQLKRPDVYKPFSFALLLMFFQQFSGINAVMFYATDIFKDAGSTIKPSVATIIVGTAQVIATVVGSLLVDRLGRKILLVVSSAGHVISLGVLGIYYHQTSGSSGDSGWGWVPVFCLVVFIISFSIGMGPIPWMMIPEMTPNFARSAITAISTALNWTVAFIITKNFEDIKDFATKHGTFWIFAGTSLVCIGFVIYFLPETKGISVDEIQKIFLGGRTLPKSVPTEHALSSDATVKDSVAGLNESDKVIEMKRYAVTDALQDASSK